jgi:hypothetical protein
VLERKQVALVDQVEDQVGSPAGEQGDLEQQAKEMLAALLVDHQTAVEVVEVLAQ